MPDARPNIILITTDQQRYDSLSAHGSRFLNTPNLDRLAREGCSFSRAYCPNTVCTPSRVSLMTGLHLSRHGAYNIGTQALEYGLFLSTQLRAAGYRTHHIGKAHWHPWGVEDSPENMRMSPEACSAPFRDFAGFETAELSIGHVTYGITAHYAHWLERKGHRPGDFEVTPLLENDMNGTGDWTLPADLHSGAWLAERACAFLREQVSEGPFYLNLGFQDPHHPHILPAGAPRLDPAGIPPPCIPEEQGDTPDHIPLFRNDGLQRSRFTGRFDMAGQGATPWEAYFRDEHKSRLTRAYYYSMVELIDAQLGRILQALDDSGLADNTVVVFTTDHGEMLGDHAIGQKGPLVYEGVTHIPLLIRYPEGFAPCTVGECVSLVDVAPTLLDFAGVAVGTPRDGVSLRRRLESARPLARSGVRIEYKEEPDRIRYKAWVTPDWKLAVYPGETFGELYHLADDPDESRNLYGDPSCAEVTSRLLTDMVCDMERSEPLSPRPVRC